jgi:ankyrin repeat protein
MYQKECEKYRNKSKWRKYKCDWWCDVYWDDYENGDVLKFIIKDEDVEMFRLFLENGFNVNQSYKMIDCDTKAVKEENSPFFSYLLTQGKFKLLNLALDYGLDPNIKYKSRDETVLINMCATVKINNKNECIKFFKKCIEKGVDVNAKDIYGMDALLFAITRDHYELIKILLENGANIKTVATDQSNVLHNADDANIKIIKLLMEYGAEELLNDKKKGTPTSAGPQGTGYTPVMCAMFRSDENLLYYLSLGAEVDYVTENGESFWSMLYRRVKYEKNDKILKQIKKYLGENRVEENLKKEKNKERMRDLFN